MKHAAVVISRCLLTPSRTAQQEVKASSLVLIPSVSAGSHVTPRPPCYSYTLGSPRVVGRRDGGGGERKGGGAGGMGGGERER